MTDPHLDPLAEYRAVVARVDAFVAAAEPAQSSHLACKAGCDGCCRTRRTAWGVELVALAAWLAEHPERVAPLAARREHPDVVAGARCVFLDDDGQCDVYPARPVLCRTHGPAVRSSEGLAWCGLNFVGLDAAGVEAAVAAEHVLDLERVNTLLAVVNQRFQAQTGAPLRGPLEWALDFELES